MSDKIVKSDKISDLLSKHQLLISGENGVDVTATTEAIAAALSSELEELSKLNAKISSNLDNVIDSLPKGVNATIGALCNVVSMRLAGNDVEKIDSIKVQVEQVIRTSGRFDVKRGRNGGVIRLS